jgi:anti-sigma B factor antagonist
VHLANIPARNPEAPDHAKVLVRGDVDLEVAPRLTDCGRECLDAPEVSTLVIDLTEVTFMDSTGLSALVQIRNVALSKEKRLVVTGVPERVERLFEITGLHDHFGQADDLDLDEHDDGEARG